MFHPGTIGFWRNWRNQYTNNQFQVLIDYVVAHNPLVYNGAGGPLTIAKVDAIYNYGTKTPRDQQILGQLTAVKFDLAISNCDGVNGLVQKNDDIFIDAILDVSLLPGATSFWNAEISNDGVLYLSEVVARVEGAWNGSLTTNRSNWTFTKTGTGFTTNGQRDIVIQTLTGVTNGNIVTAPGTPGTC
jgi:hypothetical protein